MMVIPSPGGRGRADQADQRDPAHGYRVQKSAAKWPGSIGYMMLIINKIESSIGWSYADCLTNPWHPAPRRGGLGPREHNQGGVVGSVIGTDPYEDHDPSFTRANVHAGRSIRLIWGHRDPDHGRHHDSPAPTVVSREGFTESYAQVMVTRNGRPR